MAAATITTALEGVMEEEHKVLTVTDGETYLSGLSIPVGAQLSLAEAHGGNAGSAVNLSYALSGGTFTITYKVGGAAITDKKISITAFGRK